MILLNIFDIKNLMSYLLLKDTFDNCLLEELKVTTFAKMSLEGRRNKGWYDTEENPGDLPDLLYWREARPFVLQYIRGKRTPTSFAISLKVPKEVAVELSGENELAALLSEEEVELLLHFRFEQDRLSVVTGCSHFVFTMDRRAEFSWDEAIKSCLKKLKIAFENV